MAHLTALHHHHDPAGDPAPAPAPAGSDRAARSRHLELLASHWTTSLASAEAALRHAAIDPDERAARDRKLRDQRTAAVALLADLARDWSLEPLLADAA